MLPLVAMVALEVPRGSGFSVVIVGRKYYNEGRKCADGGNEKNE